SICISRRKSILFIHGFSQCGLAWRRQIDSELASRFRLVAMDLRGHGQSEKPADAYGDARLWAEDVHAVIGALDLKQPVLVGWSYGGFVICDYLRYYGDHDVSGINFIGAATKISQETAPAILGSDFLSLLPGFFSHDTDETIATLVTFAGICTHRQLDRGEFYLTLGFSALVPPAVRLGLLSRTIDNDDLLPKLRVPVVISHGERDRIVHAQVARDHAALIPNAELSMYADAGHAVFLDDAGRFNRELARFVDASSGVGAGLPTRGAGAHSTAADM
ncbi:MAG: alpha/beta hydrolase, partial [Dehalococcoidia bacterium]